MRSFLQVLITLSGIAAAVPLAQPQTGAPSGHEVEIVGLNFGGTGCPNQSVSGIMSDDKTTLSLTFDAYTVQSGPNIPATERRKFCQLQLKLRYPSGYQYSIFGAEYRGYASLSEGVEGTCTSTYYFAGETNQKSFPTAFKGPMDQSYLKHDEVDAPSTLPWSPCGAQGLLNIKSEISIKPFSSTAINLLTVDTVDAKFTQKYYVQWQKCPGSGNTGSTSPIEPSRPITGITGA